jgi:hypothetical protein
MKTLKIIIVIILVIILIPVLSWVFWNFKSSHPLNILVVNKTVLDQDRKGHKALFWLLNNQKFLTSDGKEYNIRKDYFGFHPLRPAKSLKYEVRRIKLTDIEDLSSKYDMAYYVDTYGVFFNEWYSSMQKGKGKGSLIEGGLNNSDYLFIKSLIEKGKLLIAEYNFFANPTDILVRKKTEEMLGIEWTGWIGSYMVSLNAKKSKDLPEWIVDLYNLNNKNKWSFNGPGIVLVNEGRKAVIVLEESNHLTETILPELKTTNYGKEKYNLPASASFPRWFDINTSTDNEIIAECMLPVNESGQAILDQNNIPAVFPAIMTSTRDSRYYYFAGDFVNYPVRLCTARLNGIRTIEGLFNGNNSKSHSFYYWSYYLPLVTTILSDYQASLK